LTKFPSELHSTLFNSAAGAAQEQPRRTGISSIGFSPAQEIFHRFGGAILTPVPVDNAGSVPVQFKWEPNRAELSLDSSCAGKLELVSYCFVSFRSALVLGRSYEGLGTVGRGAEEVPGVD